MALVPAAGFGLLYAQSKRLIALIAALAWLAYFPYELAMKLRILCSGECNIRVDLLLIYPLLVALSASSVTASIRSLRARRRSSTIA